MVNKARQQFMQAGFLSELATPHLPPPELILPFANWNNHKVSCCRHIARIHTDDGLLPSCCCNYGPPWINGHVNFLFFFFLRGHLSMVQLELLHPFFSISQRTRSDNFFSTTRRGGLPRHPCMPCGISRTKRRSLFVHARLPRRTTACN